MTQICNPLNPWLNSIHPINRSVVVDDVDLAGLIFSEGGNVQRGIEKHGLDDVPEDEDLSRTEIPKHVGAVRKTSLPDLGNGHSISIR